MISKAGMIALAALALTGAQAGAQEQAAEPLQVTVVLAHPDDELFMAPALAALARQGARVQIAYATQGDAGPGVSDLKPGKALGEVRLKEAFCAAEALGAASVASLNRGDGTLGLNAHHEGSTAGKLLVDLDSWLAETDMILTWGPDGGYGHADHRMVSAIVTQIAQARPPGQRPKLLYVGIPAGSLPPVPEMADWATTDPALLTETIAYTPADLAAAKAAAMCHVTQFPEASRQGMMGLFDATMWRGKVHFRPAF
ncbi:MAG: PIG-L family deacetylase [Erythrobacter sp.]|jgi:LmbE family N-acetylglucosaminyl deacetylase|uniref:PIG-L family deacetylase n=1 Tax=Erythrobacter sp. TaxID=1042 RepID=UPI002B49237C|nr:PIG-L family deacetylase [Erythrobacter sp.]WRH69826.1 MAG: PIG-L family deacetylase [Erythrobacter sp.]